MPKSWIKLIACIALCQSAGFLGTFFTLSAIPNWYLYLEKPFFSPPNWIFGPVWTTLYTMMGISLYLNWIKLSDKKFTKQYSYIRLSIAIFLIHLIFNTAWSIIFFGMKDIFSALIVIIIIWGFIVWMIKRFYQTDKWASWLLVPYLAWVSFATLLNLNLWLLN